MERVLVENRVVMLYLVLKYSKFFCGEISDLVLILIKVNWIKIKCFKWLIIEIKGLLCFVLFIKVLKKKVFIFIFWNGMIFYRFLIF